MARYSSPVMIEDEAAYEAAIARRIQANSMKTAIRTNWIGQNDHREIVQYLEKSRASDDTFVGKMRTRYRDYGKLSDGQVAAIRRSLTQKKERAAQFAAASTSTHQGEIKGRLSVKNVTVLAAIPLLNESFGYGETVAPQLTIMKDEAGNVYKVKSGSFKPAKKDVLDIVGTVKAHDSYNGEANTVLQRVKVERHVIFIPEVPACLDTDPATLQTEADVQTVIDAGSNWRSEIYKLNLTIKEKDELSETITKRMVGFHGRLLEIANEGTVESLTNDWNTTFNLLKDNEGCAEGLAKYRAYINGKLAKYGTQLPE